MKLYKHRTQLLPISRNIRGNYVKKSNTASVTYVHFKPSSLCIIQVVKGKKTQLSDSKRFIHADLLDTTAVRKELIFETTRW